MSSKSTNTIAFAMGTGIAGLLTGFTEAIYRDASLLYAMLLYGALCAAGGLLALPAIKLIPVDFRPTRLGSIGAALTLFVTTTVIGRFLLLRDFFEESAKSNLPATAIALVLGLAAAATVYSVGRAFGQPNQHLTFGKTLRGYTTKPTPDLREDPSGISSQTNT